MLNLIRIPICTPCVFRDGLGTRQYAVFFSLKIFENLLQFLAAGRRVLVLDGLDPAAAKMYGLLLMNMEEFVVRTYGQKQWDEVRAALKIKDVSFPHKRRQKINQK